MTSALPHPLLAALAEPVLVTDARGVVTYANPAGVSRFGWDKLIGLPITERIVRWPIFTPNHLPIGTTDDPIAVALASREPVSDFRFTVETARGRWASFTMNTVPLLEHGELHG